MEFVKYLTIIEREAIKVTMNNMEMLVRDYYPIITGDNKDQLITDSNPTGFYLSVMDGDYAKREVVAGDYLLKRDDARFDCMRGVWFEDHYIMKR